MGSKGSSEAPVHSAMSELMRVRGSNSSENEDTLRRTVASQLEATADSRGGESDRRLQGLTFKRVVKHPMFEGFFASAIIANAILMGVQTDDFAANLTEGPAPEFEVATAGFTILFAVELLANLLCERRSFFTNPSTRAWNMLDFFLVATSTIELLLTSTATGMQSGGGTSQLRLLRILRITRLVRIVRITRIVRFIRALRMLVHQIISTLRSLVWGLLLLTILMYGFSIFFTQMALDLIANQADVLSAQETEILGRYWGSVTVGMFTLFKSVTGGISWTEVVAPLAHGSGGASLFIIYICITQLAVLNVLTGAFCHNAIESAQHDQDLATQSMLANKERYVHRLRQLFREFDKDGTGNITILDFLRHLKDEKVKAYFDALELDASDAWAMFKLMDSDMGNTIDVEEFVEGCMKLRGPAKSVDLHKLSKEHQRMAKRLTSRVRRMDEALYALAERYTSEMRCSDVTPRTRLTAELPPYSEESLLERAVVAVDGWGGARACSDDDGESSHSFPI